MKKPFLFVYDYLVGDVPDEKLVLDELMMPDTGSLCETGQELIDKVVGLIALRRPVLLTGSRGCGKSYCALRGALKAEETKLIGGTRFLQGNRELPREYLSEDGLVIDGRKAVTIPALAMTPIDAKPNFANIYGVKKPDEYVRWLKSLDKEPDEFPWPAMPASLVDKFLDGDGKDDPRARFWKPDDWWVLFLDEVNRFGDGFLDGLLSLAEEGKIVRRGQAYYVPVVLVCTANPPGYDITAKRLSPPLQSRIAAAYRIGQPSLEVLNEIILEDRLKQLQAKNANAAVFKSHLKDIPDERNGHAYLIIPDELRALAAAYLLCLWGQPGIMPKPQGKLTKGIHYLTSKTRWGLHELIAVADFETKAKDSLAQRLDELGNLAEYGPDARAIGDWFALVIQKLLKKNDANPSSAPLELDAQHLREECIAVLGKKIRETYNEAADPDKDQAKETLLLEIFDILFTGSTSERIRQLVYRNQRDLLSRCDQPAQKTLNSHISSIDPRWRSRHIEAAIDLLSRDLRPEGPSKLWAEWRDANSRSGLLPGILFEGCFRSPEARHSLSKTVELAGGSHRPLAKVIMLLPCVNNLANLQLFAAAARGEGKILKNVTSYSTKRVGSSLDDGLAQELVMHVHRLYLPSRLPRWRKCPERVLALAFGFADYLTDVSNQPTGQAKTSLDEAVFWYLGWFLEETMEGVVPDVDLLHPMTIARPIKDVIAEASRIAEVVIALLSRKAGEETLKTFSAAKTLFQQRVNELKGASKKPFEPGGDRDKITRWFDVILSGQGDRAGFDDNKAKARLERQPFNLAGY